MAVVRRQLVDATGTLCPVPLLLAARVMAELRPGDLLEIVGDDPSIREDVPAWCEQIGHRLLEMSREGAEGKRIRCLVEKGGGTNQISPTAPASPASRQPGRKARGR